MKSCYKCQTRKSRSSFYKSSKEADGLQAKCIDCCKDYQRKYVRSAHGKSVKRKNQDKNREHIQEYFRRPDVKARARRYRDSYAGKVTERRRIETARSSGKQRARSAVLDAIRSGKMRKRPCAKCGSKNAQAHHEDYTKPLDVIWFCRIHHMERHREINREKWGLK